MNISYIFFAGAILAQSLAQILQKRGIVEIGGLSGIFHDVGKALSNYYLVSGLFLSVVGMVCWLGAMSRFKLSFLYSFGAISYVMVCLLSVCMLGETITPLRWGGIALIITGCVVINL